jgi:hypothetical protein
LPQAAWRLFGSGMMYVQPACLSSTAVWSVSLLRKKSPDRSSGGIEFVVSAAGMHETAPSINASRANKCLSEFMVFKRIWFIYQLDE